MSLAEIHTKCGEIFAKELLREEGGNSLACDIWDVMTENVADCDNCIGENFNQLILSVNDNWFENYKPEGNQIQFYAYTYIFWLYLFIERMEFIINEIDPNRTFDPIKDFCRERKAMEEVRLWANFIKHPKHFFFVHWPTFIFIGEPFDKADNPMVITTSYLKDHYSNQEQAKPKELANNDKVVVQFPRLDILTTGFCKDLKEFFRFICRNDLVAKPLRQVSNRKFKSVE
jgi:hypothetical protein